jgi:hypothetical protein
LIPIHAWFFLAPPSRLFPIETIVAIIRTGPRRDGRDGQVEKS